MGLTKPIEQNIIKLSGYIYVSERYYTRSIYNGLLIKYVFKNKYKEGEE